MIEFNADSHEYKDGDKKLISVTQLLRKHGLAPDYSGVSDAVLNAKAERGTLIHSEIEDFIKNGELGFTSELSAFIDVCAENGVNPLESEKIVYNDVVAGKFDLLCEERGKTVLVDYKTTATLHKDSVSWQLSIYKNLYEGMTGKKIDELKVYHFTNGGLRVVDVPEKPQAEVERLMQCEREGTQFTQGITVSEKALAELAEVESLIKTIEEQKKEAQARSEQLRAAIMTAMKENGVLSLDNDRMKITYVAPYSRTSVDSARLKKDHPEIYSEYQKSTTVNESLKITIKDGEKS